jgi:nicotinamide-nucleotide amidase
VFAGSILHRLPGTVQWSPLGSLDGTSGDRESAASLGYAPAVEPSRRLQTAELISVGSELTVGETRDTNAGDMARSLTELGLAVGRIQAVPDELETVADAFRGGLARADVVVSTGGLGPTPDDLTREAIAAVCGETPEVDPELEAWLRGLWSRRGIPMPDLNLKQAWLIPSATALPNANGTAPGWWVQRPDGRIVVALPGPPREMRPMWTDTVLARLRELGAGAEVARRTFRLAGIGESVVAERIGDELLRTTNPSVATYARWDAVDVRVSAVGPAAADIVEATARRVGELLGDHVWAEGEVSWADAIGEAIEARGWTLASVEIGTGGSLAGLLADRPWLRLAEVVDAAAPAAKADADPPGPRAELDGLARLAMARAGSDVAVAVRARPRGGDTAVSVAVVSGARAHHERHIVFLGGPPGRLRAGLSAASVLLRELRRIGPAATGARSTPGAGRRARL